MAYKSFNKEHIALTKVIENYFGADAYAWDISCLDVARAVLQAGWEKPVFQWIPVTERLPDMDEMCLLCMESRITKYRWVTIGYFHTNYDEYVTHWMPLPQPPKGE